MDAGDLLTAQAAVSPARAKKPAKARMLADATLADVFGLDMAVADAPAEATTDKPMSAKRAKKAVVEKAAAPAARKAAVKKPAAKKAVAKKAALPAAKKAVAKKAATGKPAAKKVSAL